MIILLLTTYVGAFLVGQFDYTELRRIQANASASIVVRTSEVEVEFSIPKTFYEIGDTINITARITNVGDSGILVWDTAYFAPEAGIDESSRSIHIGLGIDWDGHRLIIGKLMKLRRSESVFYNIRVDSDSLETTGKYNRHEIDCSAICWRYFDSLEYITKEDKRVVAIRKFKDAVTLETNSFHFSPGNLEILVVSDND